MIEYEVHYDEVCIGQELGQVIFPGKRNFTTSLTLCQSVGGNLIEIESQGQHEKAINLMNTSSFCPATWISWWDENDEGNWVSAINSSKHLTGNSFQNWAPGEPNGGPFSNCARIVLDGRSKGKYDAINYKNIDYKYWLYKINFSDKWADTSCESKHCVICNMKSTPVFEMRGLCDDTSFEKHFSLTGVWNEKTEHYNFKGYSGSSIKWNNDKKEWRLTLSQDVNIYGFCNETNGDYPFGLLNWHFFNDACQADSSDGSGTLKIPISFSGEY